MRSYQKSTTGILINLPSGKVSKTGERKPIKSQLSLTCRLYSIRRLAFFSPQYNNALYQAFKEIKYAIAHFNGNFILLVSMGMRLCKQLEIDPYRKVLENEAYLSLYNQALCLRPIILPQPQRPLLQLLPPAAIWAVLYPILITEILYPLFSLQDSDWHPYKDFSGLVDALKTHGAHVFIGKFGAAYYSKTPQEYPNISHNSTRKIYFFKRDSYDGWEKPDFHAVVVDQAEIIDGCPMVFFRDPYDTSAPGKTEIVYMMRYASFIQRLTDNTCQYYHNDSRQHYGIVSQDPRN